MTSYADDFTLLASAPSIVETEARASQLTPCTYLWISDCSYKVGWQRRWSGPPPSNRPSWTTVARSYRSALSQLRSCYSSRLQFYRYIVGSALILTPPIRLPLHRPQGGPSLQLPYPSKILGTRGYVGGTLPGSSIPGRAPTVQRSAPTADRLRLLSLLTLIPAVGHLCLKWVHIIFISPFTPSHFTRGPYSVGHLPPSTIQQQHNFNRPLKKKAFKYCSVAVKYCSIAITNGHCKRSSRSYAVIYYASPSSGEAYSDRQLTTNIGLWVEIFCVPTCFHMRIPNPCLSVPREKKSPWLRQYQSYISNWYINGKVFTSTTPWKPKNLIFFSKKFEIEFDLYFDLCWRAKVNIQVGRNKHLYVDIEDASSSLWGSTSSFNDVPLCLGLLLKPCFPVLPAARCYFLCL